MLALLTDNESHLLAFGSFRTGRGGISRISRHLVILVVCFVAICALTAGEAYRNPVVASDLPDPSVIRTEDGYWATATSSEWAPHFPLLHSTDLVNWEATGWVFRETPAWAKGSFWAPEISEYRGSFFVYYTARRQDGRLAVAVATAPKPGGPYTDHGELVAQPAGSIDPMALTDVEGHRWLVWKEDGNSQKLPTFIFLQRLSDDGLKLIGTQRQILVNDAPWEGAVVEGPFVLRHGDYYYLFYSGAGCCGRGCNYALGVARANQLEGPWEKCPANPLIADNTNWRCPGHGSIAQDPDGRYWLLYHGYAREDFVATGRQMLLDEVVFGTDGWPSINHEGGPSTAATPPRAFITQRDSRSLLENFSTLSALSQRWQWPIGYEPRAEIEQGYLKLTVDSKPAMIGLSARSASFVAETSVHVTGEAAGGLGVFGNEANAISLLAENGRLRIVVRQRSQDRQIAAVPLPKGEFVRLRLASSDGNSFRFAFAPVGGEWNEIIAETEGKFLPQWDRAIRVGLEARGSKGAASKFAYFSLSPDGSQLLVAKKSP